MLWIRIWIGSALSLEAEYRIRIGIRVKSWIRIRIKSEIQKLYRPKIEPWRAVDAHNGGLEAQYEALEIYRSVVTDSDHFEEELDQDPYRHQNDADPQH